MSREAIEEKMLARLRQVGPGLVVGKIPGNRILVDPVRPFNLLSKLEASGLIVAPSEEARRNAEGDSSTGVIVSVGEAVPKDGGWQYLQPGTMVLWSVHAGHSIKVEGQPWMIIDANDIICTIECNNGLESIITDEPEQVYANPLPRI